MSILIKGMEMPKNCDSCMFSRRSIHNIDWCVLTEEDIPCACPLVPVPPHGRLIDVNALCVTAIDITDLPVGECLMVYLKEDIDNAPTIIEAEEGE